MVGDSYVFVSMDQHYVEQKLAATFSVITASPDMSARCAEFAIPGICHSTFPLCDRMTQRQRKLCRYACEVLEQDVCKSELAIAKSHPLIGHQMSLLECDELPAIGSLSSHNCVKLGIPGLDQLIQPTVATGQARCAASPSILISTTVRMYCCLPLWQVWQI